MIHSLWIVISAVLFPPVAAERSSPTETFPFDPSKWTLVNSIIKQWLAFSDAWGQGKRGFMGKHNDQKGPTERLVEFVGISGDATSAEINGNAADYRWAGTISVSFTATTAPPDDSSFLTWRRKATNRLDCHVTWLWWRKVSEFFRSILKGRKTLGWVRPENTLAPCSSRWTLQPAPISSQRWCNWQGRTEQGRHLWSSPGSSSPHCTFSLPLYVHRLLSPPSLSHYPPATAGQFVHPAWLPPPLLLRYLAPLLHFNGRYWLELPRPPLLFPVEDPSPSQQPLIWLQAFRSFSEEASPRRTIAEQVVSQTLSLWLCGSEEARCRADCTITTNYHSVRPSAALRHAGEFFFQGAQTAKSIAHLSSWDSHFICTFWFMLISEIKGSNVKPVVSS